VLFMTSDITTVSVDTLDAALATAAGSLAQNQRHLAAALLRLLAAGKPVSVPSAAAAAGIPEPAAGQALRSWPAVFWDDHDQVVGFWGLALAETPPHRIRHAETDLSAWCAWDPLFPALVIGDLRVATTDPVTGEAITYRIGHDGAITGASHPDSVLSFLRPDTPWDDDVITTFCRYVRHFTSPATAERWIADHPGTFVISLADATGLTRRHVTRTFGIAAA
jgi:hypothetical protein